MSGFDYSELDDFSKDLLGLSQDFEKGKHTKKFLRSAGNKLKRRTVKNAKSTVKKKTGNLFKGIKRGKPYKYHVDGSIAVRVYGGKPAHHAHLLNNGHRYIDKNGVEKMTKGHHFFESGANEYEGEWTEDVENFVDELLDKHGM